MRALKNPRRKRCAQELVCTADAADYRNADHKSEGAVAEAAELRSPQNVPVGTGIAELRTTLATAVTIPEMTTAQAITEFEQARKLALKKGQASAAVSATLAKVKLAGLLANKPESPTKRAVGFDGNYNEAARRILLLLRLAANETSDGHKR